jgi:hypothetical protein
MRGAGLQHLARELRALRAFVRLVRRSRARALWVLAGGFAALPFLRGFVIPPLAWDSITYHGPRAAQWVATGRFTFPPGVGAFDFYRHFFAGGEVLSAWAMLPFHSDLLANLASFLQWIGLGLSAWALARVIGLREPFASTSAAVVSFVPTLQLELNSGYVELALNAALLHGIAAALSCMRRPSVGLALAAALSLGVAVAIKLPGAPPAAAVAAVLWLRLIPARALSLRQKLGALAASACAALLPAAPFMFRAYLDTGYPLSPMPARLFGITLGVASPSMRWYAERGGTHPFEWQTERDVLAIVFAPLARLNETFGSPALVFLLVFPIGLFVLARRRPLFALALSLAALSPVLAYYSEGLTPVRMVRPASSTRFLLPAFALIVPISLLWCRRGQPLSAAYRALLLGYAGVCSVVCLRRGVVDWENRELALVAGALGFGCAGVVWLYRRRQLLALGLGLLGCAWFCSALQLRRDETRSSAYGHSFALHGFQRFWTGGVAAIDDLAHPYRIAVTGGPDHSSDKWFQYFFLGRRFQNRTTYVTPTRDGGIAYYGPGGDLDQRADRDSWLRRLDEARIDVVLTFPPRSLEQGWMEELGERFEKIAGTDDWGLYRIRR